MALTNNVALGTQVLRPTLGGGAMTGGDEESFISSLARNTGSAVEQLGLLLDTPGAITRGILAGDPTSGFNWDYDKRVSGEELLRSYGALKEDDNSWKSTAAGMLTEVATDPLSWFSFPMGALTKAGKAARAANILDYAPAAAQKIMGSSAADSMTGRLANSALEDLLPMGLSKTADDYAVRPMVGPRVARTKTTIDDVIAAAPDPQKALDDVTKYLTTQGLDYDAIKGERLGGAFGIGPFSPWATFTPAGSEKVLDALDAAGQAIGWSYPARLASSFFDSRVGGMIDAGDQMAAMRQNDLLDRATAVGRREASRHAETVTRLPLTDNAKRILGADSLLSTQGNDFLTRLAEGKPTTTDIALFREIPGINNYVASWDRIRKNNARYAEQLGLDYTPLTDPKGFGVKYSPRGGTEFDFKEYGTGFGRSQYQSRVFEDMSRNPNLHTPGGTVDLREVSLLPSVRQWVKEGRASTMSPASIGSEIANYINRKHGRQAIDQAQGEGIARVMQRLNTDLPENMPAFASHPLNEQSRVIISQEVARTNARYVYDELARYAVGSNANQIPGTGFKNLAQAANEIAAKVGLKTGSQGLDPAVQKNLVDRVAANLGILPSQVDLTKVAIPEEVYNRLNRIEDFYSSPRAQKEVSGMLDSITQMWKSFLLAFPARHSRDMISNAITVWLETGSPLATTRGFSLAKQVLSGNIDAALPQLAQLPAFQGLSGNPDALRSAVYQEIAASGILTGLAQADILASRRSGELSRVLPGVSPVSRLGALKEFAPDGSRTVPQMLRDQTQIKGLSNKFQTGNSLLNWSMKLTDANDSIARLGGWFALLSLGDNAERAAARMQNALVNYESLTPFERGFMRKIFPWYSYTSRIGKYAVGSLMENPGGPYAQMIRGVNILGQEDDDTYVPAWLRSKLSLRIPDAALEAVGIPQAPGVQTFASLGGVLPGIEALGMVNPSSFSGTLRNLAAATNPFIKGGAELIFDEDLFSKLPLADSDPAVNKVYRYLSGGGELSPTAKVIGSNLPAMQRVMGIAGSMLDDRYPMEQKLPKTAINSLLGIHVANTDEKARTSDAMQQLDRLMAGYTKTFPRTYTDKEALATAPPDIQQMAILRALMEKKAAAIRKQEKQAPRQQAYFP